MSDQEHYGDYLFDDPWITGLVKRICEERDAATKRAEVAEAQIANDYYMRRTAELATELEQLRTELAGVLETALIRGESLGYIEIDNDYRERLRELDPDAEILQDE